MLSQLKMSDETLATYSNTEVIAISQDVLGKQGIRIFGGDLASKVPDGGPSEVSVPLPIVPLP